MAEYFILCDAQGVLVPTGVADEGTPNERFSLVNCPSCGHDHEWTPATATRVQAERMPSVSVELNHTSLIPVYLRRRLIKATVDGLASDVDPTLALRLHGVKHRLDLTDPDWPTLRLVLGTVADSTLLEMARDIAVDDSTTNDLLEQASEVLGQFPEQSQMASIKADARSARRSLATASDELSRLLDGLHRELDKNGDPDNIGRELWAIERIVLPAIDAANGSLAGIAESANLRDLMLAAATLNANVGVVERVVAAITHAKVQAALTTILTILQINAIVR